MGMRKLYPVEPIITNIECASWICSISRFDQQSLGKESSGVKDQVYLRQCPQQLPV
jgi:hypothetical protein